MPARLIKRLVLNDAIAAVTHMVAVKVVVVHSPPLVERSRPVLVRKVAAVSSLHCAPRSPLWLVAPSRARRQSNARLLRSGRFTALLLRRKYVSTALI